MNKAAAQRLLEAIRENDWDVFQKSLRERAVDDTQESFEAPAFALACWRPSHARIMMAALLEAGLNPNLVKSTPAPKSSKDILSNVQAGTPLLFVWCQSRNDFSVDGKGLEAETEPDSFIASSTDRIVLDLIEAGANPDIGVSWKPERQESIDVWEAATEAGRGVVLEALSKRGSVEAWLERLGDREHPIVRAFSMARRPGTDRLAQWWADQDPQWHERRQNGETIVMQLEKRLCNGNEGVVWAIRRGAAAVDVRIDQENAFPWTAWCAILDYAGQNNDISIVKEALSNEPWRAALNLPSPRYRTIIVSSGQNLPSNPWETPWDRVAGRRHGARSEIWLDMLELLRAAGARSYQTEWTLAEQWAFDPMLKRFDAEKIWNRMAIWLDRHPDDERPHPITGNLALSRAQTMEEVQWFVARGQSLDHVNHQGEQAFAQLMSHHRAQAGDELLAWGAEQWAAGRVRHHGHAKGRSLSDWVVGHPTWEECFKKDPALLEKTTPKAWLTLVEKKRWTSAREWLERYPDTVSWLDQHGESPWVAVLNHQPYQNAMAKPHPANKREWQLLAEEVVKAGARWDVLGPGRTFDRPARTVEQRFLEPSFLDDDDDWDGETSTWWVETVMKHRTLPETLWNDTMYFWMKKALWKASDKGRAPEQMEATMDAWHVHEWSEVHRAEALLEWLNPLVLMSSSKDLVVKRWLARWPDLLDINLGGKTVAQKVLDLYNDQKIEASAMQRESMKPWITLMEGRVLHQTQDRRFREEPSAFQEVRARPRL